MSTGAQPEITSDELVALRVYNTMYDTTDMYLIKLCENVGVTDKLGVWRGLAVSMELYRHTGGDAESPYYLAVNAMIVYLAREILHQM